MRNDPGTTSRSSYRWAGSTIIDALIDDGDAKLAWAEATSVNSQRVDNRQWRRLADLVATDQPADALAVYTRLIEPMRQQTGDDIYRQVARLLLAARGCHDRLGTSTEFATYLANLRADQRRKPNLMRILNDHGL